MTFRLERFRTEKDKQMIQRETEEIRISMDDLVRAKVELNCGAFFHFAFLHVGRSLFVRSL